MKAGFGEDQDNGRNDRELIQEFLEYAEDVQTWLGTCEQNNAKMKKQAE